MPIFLSFRSKKFLQRIVISFSLLVLLMVSLFSFILYYNAENVILRMQNQANKKILSQINFNISYLNDILPKLTSALYYDSNVVALMSKRDEDPLDALVSRSRIDRIANYTPFILSIVIYNGYRDKFYWGGDSGFQDKNAPIYAEYRDMFQSLKPLPKQQMIPIGLSEGQIDFFSVLNYDAFDYQAGDSVFILNIKPDWLFNNIKLINDLNKPSSEMLFIAGKNGKLLAPGNSAVQQDILNDTSFQRRLQSFTDPSGSFRFDWDGKKMMASYYRTDMNGWTLINVVPYNKLLKNVHVLRLTSILLAVAFLVLSLIAIVGISHRLYRPLGSLFQSMRQNAGDHLDHPAEPLDELSYMSNVYKQTMQHLLASRLEQRSARNIVRSYYTIGIVTDSLTTKREQLESWIERHELKIDLQGSFVLCILKLDEVSESGSHQAERERKLLQFAVANIADEILSSHYNCELAELKKEHMLVVISLESGTAGLPEQIISLFRRIQLEFQRLYQTTCSVSVSTVIPEYTELSRHYTETQQALGYTLVYGRQALITPSMIARNQANLANGLPAELEKKLVEGYRSNQEEAFAKALGKIFDAIAEMNCDYMLYMVLHVFILLKGAVKEINDNRIVPVSIDFAEYNSKILQGRSLLTMQEVLMDLFRQVTESKRSPEDKRNEVLVDTIKEMINQRYQDITLSLQLVCDTLKLSPDFIGKLFKKHQGISVAEYINEVRLRQAVYLLESGDYSINDLIERVGFGTPSSFFRLFKSKYGTTPKEYRIKHNIDGKP